MLFVGLPMQSGQIKAHHPVFLAYRRVRSWFLHACRASLRLIKSMEQKLRRVPTRAETHLLRRWLCDAASLRRV